MNCLYDFYRLSNLGLVCLFCCCYVVLFFVSFFFGVGGMGAGGGGEWIRLC